jgi:fused signal recognition particle receptor
MFDFLKRKEEGPSQAENAPLEKSGFFSRLKQGLSKTRAHFSTGLSALIFGKKALNKDLLEELETYLLSADVGVAATQQLIQSLTQQLDRKELLDSTAVLDALKNEMISILRAVEKPLLIPEAISPFVILMIGVNGAGKTTTIGKIACYFKEQHKKVILAAGDTFRAAAIEQLQAWGERNQVPVVAQQTGADSAAVIYDAYVSAKARGMDILLADTAGRLHTQTHLMDELKKVKRVLGRIDQAAPHETLLVLDAGIGQNALAQAKQFNEAMGVTGIVVTKLDGTAKGGMVLAIAKTLHLPIRFIGVGEGISDLRPFKADDFISALFE